MVFPWRSTKGVKPDALKGARPVLNGGDEETGLCRPRLVATQRESEYLSLDIAQFIEKGPQMPGPLRV